MAVAFCLVSTKGGSGKTTLLANLAALAADMGMRVLMIDADVQPSLSRYYPLQHQAPDGLTKVIRVGSITPECISQIRIPPAEASAKMPVLNADGCLDIVLSDAPEGALQDWLATRIDRALRLRMALKTPLIDESYDFIFIDTQGAVGHLQDAAVLAADILVSPVSPDILSAREFTSGTLDMLERLEPSSSFGMQVPPMRAIIHKLENTTDSRSIAQAIQQKFVPLRGRVTVLQTVVPAAVAYRKAATAQVPVHWLDPGRPSHTMHQLIWELVPSLEGVWAGSQGTEVVEAAPDKAPRQMAQSSTCLAASR